MIKKKILLLLVFSTVSFGIGYYLAKIYDCGNSSFCNFLYFRVGDALFYGMGALALIFFILLLVPRAFNAWKMFAIWFVPLAALLFIFIPEPQGFDLLTPEPQKVFQWVSGFYIVVSVFIIFGNLFLQNFKKSTQPPSQ